MLVSLLVFSHMCAVYRQIRRNTVRRRSPFMTNVDLGLTSPHGEWD